MIKVLMGVIWKESVYKLFFPILCMNVNMSKETGQMVQINTLQERLV